MTIKKEKCNKKLKNKLKKSIKCSMFTKNIKVKILCYLRFSKHTKYGQIVLNS